MSTHEDYANAAALLWGEAGEFAAAEFARLNREHFAGSIPPVPIVIGLTAYGACLGLTRHAASWLDGPRITLAVELFNGNHRTPGGPRPVSDCLVHEMVHAALMFRGEDAGPSHGPAWCRMISDLSPGVLGHEITAEYVGPRRVPNPERETDPKAPRTVVVRQVREGFLTQKQISRWPGTLRPADYYRGGKPIPVATY